MKAVIALMLLGFSFAASAESLDRNPFPRWSGKYDVYDTRCSLIDTQVRSKDVKCQATTVEIRTKGETACITESGKGWKKESCFTQYWKDGGNFSFFHAKSHSDIQFNLAGYSEQVRPAKNEIRTRSYSLYYNANAGETWFTVRESHYVNSSVNCNENVRFYKLKAQSIWPL